MHWYCCPVVGRSCCPVAGRDSVWPLHVAGSNDEMHTLDALLFRAVEAILSDGALSIRGIVDCCDALSLAEWLVGAWRCSLVRRWKFVPIHCVE